MSVRYDLPQPGTGPYVAGNDLTVNFTLTSNGTPLDLFGLTLTVYLKATATTPDAFAATFTTSSGLTVTNVTGGQFTWTVPHADVPAIAAPGSLWYRVDVTGSNGTETAMYGALILTAA